MLGKGFDQRTMVDVLLEYTALGFTHIVPLGLDRLPLFIEATSELARARPEVLGLIREVARSGPPVSDRVAQALRPLVDSAVAGGRDPYCCFEPIGWSKDGQSIVVTAWRDNGTSQIALVPLDGSGRLRVLRNLGTRLGPGRPSLSPDGRYVAYSAVPATVPALRAGARFVGRVAGIARRSSSKPRISAMLRSQRRRAARAVAASPT